MRCYILIAVCLSCQVGATPHAQGDVDKGSRELQGEYRAVELQTSGNPAPKEVVEKARLEIKGDEMIWHSGGPVVRKSRIRLDPSKSPKEIDITALDEPGRGTTYPGIYSLEKGQLRLCWSHTKDRPKEFKTERGLPHELVLLERVKDQEKLQGTWRAVSFEEGGKESPAEDLKKTYIGLVIKGDKVELIWERKPGRVFSMTIDPAQRPKRIVLKKTEESDEKLKTCLGIYEFQGDTLKLCINQPLAKSYPADFKTSRAEGEAGLSETFVFKREKA